MPQVSVKINEKTYQELLVKKEDLALDNISDTVRFMLRLGLENLNQEGSGVPKGGAVDRLQKRALSYAIMTYCLVEESVLSLAEDGVQLSDKANAKAEKVISSIL